MFAALLPETILPMHEGPWSPHFCPQKKKRIDTSCVSWKVNSQSILRAELLACGRLAFSVFKKSRWSQMVLTRCAVCALLRRSKCSECKQTRTSSRSNSEFRKSCQVSSHLLQILIVFHGGSVPIFDVVSFRLRESYHFLLLPCECR